MCSENEKSFNFLVRPRLGILTIPILFFVFITIISCSSSSKGVKKKGPLKEFINYLDKRIPNLMDIYDIPGAKIALVQKGETVWTKAYGYADLKNGRKMTTDTYCRVESISKSVTAWGVMKLVEQGKIELDRPVGHYFKSWDFPESSFPTENITVKQLLSQTSGMPLGTIGVRYNPFEAKPTLKEILSKDAILQKEPGKMFSYSNTGFNLLELLIEEVTGRNFADYMQEEVLTPLGMHRSSFNWSETLEPPVPFGYDVKGDPIPVYVYPDKAAGGLFSTVGDIATFVCASMTDFSITGLEVLNTQNIQKLYTPEVELSGYYGLVFDAYGLGHFIELLPNRKKAVAHGGQGSGWMTHFHSVPETGDGIVILTNSQRSWPFFAHILNDWAEWNNFPSVGMGVIVLGTKLLWVFIGFLFLIALWKGYRLGREITYGQRNFESFSSNSRGVRLVQMGLSLVLLLTLIWSLNQDYFFLNSVFPIASPWLGISIFLMALVLVFSALFPKTRTKPELKKSKSISM
ncbi:serine hydrolase domain-containing protein [Flagellimonas lutaonensis]|uniref:Penicillin-binding protein, beta-lactamase class C n=1 Tax=Flagellimonas lutaonensis TaxID=516051 RepID=A0A0D5YPP7_9FLAO|nr:serine hydrolase domain-containing protein [Allomuricauda lutaonensis]AKA34285.1 Penicillin-binding protein, beta-lactamase class C [Allomuricauda lutaonensis]